MHSPATRNIRAQIREVIVDAVKVDLVRAPSDISRLVTTPLQQFVQVPV